MNTYLVIPVICCGALWLAACGDKESANTSVPPPVAAASATPPAVQKPAPAVVSCAIITAQEVEAIIGITPVQVISARSGKCDFGRDEKTPIVSVSVLPSADVYTQTHKTSSSGAKDVADVGDEAFSYLDYGLYVRKGNNTVTLSSPPKAGVGSERYLTPDQLKAIAVAIVAKLK